jgi:endonuclease YncB( thermonuclease family)
METEIAHVIRRAPFTDRRGCIGFGITLLLVVLHTGFDARAENLALEGTVSHVRDGDTIELGPIAIRLQGIAAPEGNEPGGDIATNAMRDLVLGKDLRCDLTGDRSYDRVIGVCFLKDGRDIGEVMVFEGHARDCYRFSRGRYADAERHARTMGDDLSRVYALPGYCE